MNTGNQVYEVEIRHQIDGSPVQEKRIEFYVANHITQVIKEIERDLQDERSEVVMIRAAAPVLKIIQ
jgi:hypothetical protein